MIKLNRTKRILHLRNGRKIEVLPLTLDRQDWFVYACWDGQYGDEPRRILIKTEDTEGAAQEACKFYRHISGPAGDYGARYYVFERGEIVDSEEVKA